VACGTVVVFDVIGHASDLIETCDTLNRTIDFGQGK
jgi:hypothetical protein